MANRLRIGAVTYLNTKPLVHGLSRLAPQAELIFDYPSRLADSLAEGLLDVALVPSAELLAHPGWTIVSDACIACQGPVLSVKLLFKTPPNRVRTLALDEGSRTSAILSQILLRELANASPATIDFPLGCEVDDIDADAILLIGDRAIREPEGQFAEIWDLGDRWCRHTELPFVFAMWVARENIDTVAIAEALKEARDHGIASLVEIAREQSTAMTVPYELVFNYLSRNLHFQLGRRERQGLDLFFEKAAALDLVPTITKASCE